MRRLLRILIPALLACCILGATALAAAPPAKEGGAKENVAQEMVQGMAEKSSALQGLKNALAAQGEISKETMDALKGTPMGADAPKAGDAPQGSGGTPGRPGKKAIYGDIIIHK